MSHMVHYQCGVKSLQYKCLISADFIYGWKEITPTLDNVNNLFYLICDAILAQEKISLLFPF